MSIDLLLNSNSWTNLKPNTVTTNVVYVNNSVGAPNAPVGYIGLYSNSNGILSTSDEKSATNTYLVATPSVNQSGGSYFTRNANIATYGNIVGASDLLSPYISNIKGSNTIPANSLKNGDCIVFYMDGRTTQTVSSGTVYQFNRNGAGLGSIGTTAPAISDQYSIIEFTLTMKSEGISAQALFTPRLTISPNTTLVNFASGVSINTTIDNTFTISFNTPQLGNTYTVYNAYMKKI
jgi:hypothetical protein